MKDRQHLKKWSIISVAVLTIGIAGVQFAGADGPGGWGNHREGPCYGQELSEDQLKARSAFLDETADIRKNIAVKRAEMRAIMRGDSPDSERAAALSAELFDLRETMRKKAREKGIRGFMGHGGPGMMGPRFGPMGHGPGGRM